MPEWFLVILYAQFVYRVFWHPTYNNEQLDGNLPSAHKHKINKK